MIGYSTYNTTTVIQENQNTKISVTLTQKDPKIEITNLNSTTTGVCVFSYTGTITNTGDRPAYGVLLTITLTPKVYDQKAGYVVVIQTENMGILQPGLPQPFGFSDMNVPCGGQYSGKIDWTGIDQKNPETTAGNVKISGSTTI